MLVVVLGSTVPSGLYTIYERDWGLAVSTTTLVFATYLVGVLVALVALGHLSDHLGRKPVMILAAGLSIASSVVFVLAADASLLYVGRFVSGLSVGLCTGAFTASLREHTRKPATGALLSTVITSGALAVGPLAAGLVARHMHDPLHTPYVFYAVVVVVCLLGLLAVQETRIRACHTPWLQLRVGLPSGIARAFTAAAITIGCAYAANGLFQSIMPLAAAATFHASDLGAAGYTSLMLAASAIVQIPAAKVPTRMCTRVGLAVLAAGFILVAAAVLIAAKPLLVLATLVCGIGNGLAFRGSLARVAAVAPAGSESRVVSSYYVVGYAATALPTLVAGVLASNTGLSAVLAVLTAVLATITIANTYSPDLRPRNHTK